MPSTLLLINQLGLAFLPSAPRSCQLTTLLTLNLKVIVTFLTHSIIVTALVLIYELLFFPSLLITPLSCDYISKYDQRANINIGLSGSTEEDNTSVMELWQPWKWKENKRLL